MVATCGAIYMMCSCSVASDRLLKVADVAGALATDKLGLQDYVEKAEFGDF